jgi:hypothetical protein
MPLSLSLSLSLSFFLSLSLSPPPLFPLQNQEKIFLTRKENEMPRILPLAIFRSQEKEFFHRQEKANQGLVYLPSLNFTVALNY